MGQARGNCEVCGKLLQWDSSAPFADSFAKHPICPKTCFKKRQAEEDARVAKRVAHASAMYGAPPVMTTKQMARWAKAGPEERLRMTEDGEREMQQELARGYNPCVRENPQDEDIRSIARTLSRTDIIVLSAIRFWSITPGTPTLWRGVLSVLHKQGIKSPKALVSVKTLERLGWVTESGGRWGRTIGLTNAGVRASDVISRGVELLPWDWRRTFPDEQQADPQADAIRAYQESIGMARDPRQMPNPPLFKKGKKCDGRCSYFGTGDYCTFCLNKAHRWKDDGFKNRVEELQSSRSDFSSPLSYVGALGQALKEREDHSTPPPWFSKTWFDKNRARAAPNPPLAIVGAGILANPHEGLTCWYCSLPLSISQDLCPRCGSTNSEMYNPPCVPCGENPQDDLDALVRRARTGDVSAYRQYVREAVRRGILEKSLGTMSHGWGATWTPEGSTKRTSSSRRKDGFFYLPWSGDDYLAMQNPLSAEETAAGLKTAEHIQARALSPTNNLTDAQRRDLMWRAAGQGDIIDLYSDWGGGKGEADAENIRNVTRAARLGSQAAAYARGPGGPFTPEPRRKANPTNRKRKGDRGKKAEMSVDEARAIAAKSGQMDAFEAAMKAHKTFHGVYPDKVTVYQVPDGKNKIIRKFVAGLGRVPETHYYKSHPDGNKANTYWVHKHPPGGEPLEVLDPSTGLTSKIGGTFKVTSWWYH